MYDVLENDFYLKIYKNNIFLFTIFNIKFQ